MFWPGRGGGIQPVFLENWALHSCHVLFYWPPHFVKKAVLTPLLTRLTHESAQIFICKAHRNCWCCSRSPLGFRILISLDGSTWAVPSLPASYQGALQRENFSRKRSFNRNTMKQTAAPSRFLLRQSPCRSSPCRVDETREARASLSHVIPPWHRPGSSYPYTYRIPGLSWLSRISWSPCTSSIRCVSLTFLSTIEEGNCLKISKSHTWRGMREHTWQTSVLWPKGCPEGAQLQTFFGTENFPGVGPRCPEDEEKETWMYFSTLALSCSASHGNVFISVLLKERNRRNRSTLMLFLSWTSKELVHQRQHTSPSFLMRPLT